MRSLLAIVANIADRSHVRQIATDRTIKQSYDPVWQWLYVIHSLIVRFANPFHDAVHLQTDSVI